MGRVEHVLPAASVPWAISEPPTRPLYVFANKPSAGFYSTRSHCRNAQTLQWLPTKMHNPRYYAKRRPAPPPPPPPPPPPSSASDDDVCADYDTDDLPFAYNSDSDDIPVPRFTSSDDDDRFPG